MCDLTIKGIQDKTIARPSYGQILKCLIVIISQFGSGGAGDAPNNTHGKRIKGV